MARIWIILKFQIYNIYTKETITLMKIKNYSMHLFKQTTFLKIASLNTKINMQTTTHFIVNSDCNYFILPGYHISNCIKHFSFQLDSTAPKFIDCPHPSKHKLNETEQSIFGYWQKNMLLLALLWNNLIINVVRETNLMN